MRIGITMRVIENAEYNERRDALSREWSEYLSRILPGVILIPFLNNADKVEDTIKSLDIKGIILSNGNDWGESRERDETEQRIVNYCKTINLPILGVCRGMQVLNIIFGGKVERDLDGISKGNHVDVEHEVLIENSPFLKLSKRELIGVNSFHKQGVLIKGLARDMKTFALTADGVVEGIFHKTLPIVAIQWHPERKSPSAVFDQQLIIRLFKENRFWD
mgnify:CR=1 FL=1